jgi:hypothetical protein
LKEFSNSFYPRVIFIEGGSKIWKDSDRNIVVIFQTNILRIVGFYVRHLADEFMNNHPSSVERLSENFD